MILDEKWRWVHCPTVPDVVGTEPFQRPVVIEYCSQYHAFPNPDNTALVYARFNIHSLTAAMQDNRITFLPLTYDSESAVPSAVVSSLASVHQTAIAQWSGNAVNAGKPLTVRRMFDLMAQTEPVFHNTE